MVYRFAGAAPAVASKGQAQGLPLRLVFHNFVGQGFDFFVRFREGQTAGFGNPVVLADFAVDNALLGLQKTVGFHLVQYRVKCAGTHPVAMTFQLIYQAQAEDRFLRGMEQYMNPDKSQKQVPEYLAVIRQSHKVILSEKD